MLRWPTVSWLFRFPRPSRRTRRSSARYSSRLCARLVGWVAPGVVDRIPRPSAFWYAVTPSHQGRLRLRQPASLSGRTTTAPAHPHAHGTDRSKRLPAWCTEASARRQEAQRTSASAPGSARSGGLRFDVSSITRRTGGSDLLQRGQPGGRRRRARAGQPYRSPLLRPLIVSRLSPVRPWPAGSSGASGGCSCGAGPPLDGHPAHRRRLTVLGHHGVQPGGGLCCACGLKRGAASRAGGVMAWGRGCGEGARGRGGR